MSICYIVGAFETDRLITPQLSDCVIAADAGYATLQRMNIKPDWIVGDFDSLGTVPIGDNVIRHSSMKNDTDMMLAIKIGLKEGYRSFRLYGGLGGRLDHSVANLQALSYLAEHEATGILLGETESATVVKNGSVCFDADSHGIISIFALNGIARGVTLNGLLYPLWHVELAGTFPIGISNEFTGKRAEIRVADGFLTVLWMGNFLPEKNILEDSI
ncbi:MAG: thiamine diphosphokinase [Clostridia bacterium]